MFKRPHHQRIAKLLGWLNADLLVKTESYFAGGTAIVLALDEYRESLDVDFLCASPEGYRLLRNTVTSNSLGDLLTAPVSYLREVHADRYGIRTVVEVDGFPIKIEFVSEGRIPIAGEIDPVLGIPLLSRVDMYAEKLLANADRGLDKFIKSRDAIDLAMMINAWGQIPELSCQKAFQAYGQHLLDAFDKSLKMIADRDYFLKCLQVAQMDEHLLDQIPLILGQQEQLLKTYLCSNKQIG